MQFTKRPLDRQTIKTAAAKLGAIVGIAILLASGALPAVQVYADAAATVIAGLPSDGPLVNDIPATSAQFWNPSDVATTSDGTIYIADMSHQEVRSIGADGIIHAAFGDGIQDCSTSGTQTRLWNPQSIVVDEHDNMYVSTACGEIVEFAPGDTAAAVVAGKFDINGNATPFTHNGMLARDVTMQPSVMAYDRASGVLYFYDGRSNHIFKLVDGLLSVAVGTGGTDFSGDGGPATAAQISGVGGMTFADGALYLSDGGHCRVRMVDPDGNISTIAGNGACRDENTTGPALAASIEYPGRLTADSNGMLYIAGGLSGTIFAYDTQTKNLAPVIQIISSTSGMAMDKDGNLLALHSGVNQRLYRITGLPSPVPPPDGKQHGRVTSVSWKVTPTTPLWNMEVTVKTSGVSCPAVAAVVIGTWQKRTVVCSAGQTAPNTTNFNWKVFSPSRSLEPGTTQGVSAFIAKSDAPHYGTSVTALDVPKRPTIVGVGDSFLSGHHQEEPVITCVRPDNTPPEDTTCNLYSNDPSYSWVTLMANKLNANIPAQWQFEYDGDHLLARSGATTRQMFQEGQVAAMQAFITQHAGSWNVVAFDGGANNINFSGALKDFYGNHPLAGNGVALVPWEAKKLSDCPNSDLLYHNLFGIDTDPNAPPTLPVPLPPAQEPIIRADLISIVATARSASNTTRFLDMLYPYATNTNNLTNVCTNGTATWHGSKSIVDNLDLIHEGNTGTDILRLDLREAFGTNPLSKLQHTTFYGYPHPNEAGQAKIAQQAFRLLKL